MVSISVFIEVSFCSFQGTLPLGSHPGHACFAPGAHAAGCSDHKGLQIFQRGLEWLGQGEVGGKWLAKGLKAVGKWQN